MIPLLQMKTADTAHKGIFTSVTMQALFPFLGGAWGRGYMAFSLIMVSCPDPTLPERKMVWLQYDIPPDPVT